MITVQTRGDRELKAKLKSLPAEVHAALLKKCNELAIKMVAYIKSQKLSGQVLNVVSGDLRDSITEEVTDTKNSVTADVFSAGNIPYAPAQEYGALINHPGGTPYYIEKATGLAVFVSLDSALAEHLPVTRAHLIPLPERSYMRSALEDMTDEIVKGLTDAVGEVL